MIRVRCPHCQKGLGLKDELAGKKIKCPNCTRVLTVPAQAVVEAQVVVEAVNKPKPKPQPAPSVPAQAVKPPDDGKEQYDDFKPYGIEAVHEVAEEAKDDRIDDLVVHAQKFKARNKAWLKVGMPSVWLKRIALITCWVVIIFFLWTTANCVLYTHNYDKYARQGPEALRSHQKDLGYYFPLDEIWSRDDSPGYVFGITLAITLGALIYLGVIIKGAESMKRLEEYNWAMTSAVLGLLYPFTLPFGVFGLVGLRDPGVMHEFEVSERRKRGITDYEAELEEEQEDEDEDDEDDDDDEEDDDD